MIWKIKRFLNVGSEKRLKEAVKVINDYAMKIIRKRETSSNSDHQDLLSRFIWCDDVKFESRDLNKKRKFLRDIIVSFVLAGKDSTSTALTWFFWVISANPNCITRIYTELTQLPQIRSGVFSYEDLKNLNYLHAAISESLRLFPPVPINSRLTVNDDVLPDGTHVKAGWFADYSAYAIGRTESVWGPDCKEFKPDRWLDKDGVFQPLDQFRFPVFHAGPRICLGKEMGYMQMKSIAASVIYGFEVEAVNGGGDVEKMKNPPYILSLTLKMKGGLPIRLKRRR
ncbi:Cytochrome p450 [Thalictrum thalictroides]|uniref:Cytochrome p450 n=1 Tax=Thalictrum thalictroides TaxID=46969 RepID=A0A7J6WIY8_THATH|nr:Cytochrome p450 [Thalictrum thalictroides]